MTDAQFKGIENEVISIEEPNNILSEEDSIFTQLQHEIDEKETGSIIKLTKNYTYDEGFKIDGITISKNVTVDGQYNTINANDKSNIFSIYNSNVILKNLNFSNSKNQGIISNNSYIVFENCKFLNSPITFHNGNLTLIKALSNILWVVVY